jgi:hypothetical protein
MLYLLSMVGPAFREAAGHCGWRSWLQERPFDSTRLGGSIMNKTRMVLLALTFVATAAHADDKKMQNAKTRVENITNYNAPRISTTTPRQITSSGTPVMTPNAQSKYGPNRGLHTGSVPAPQNPNYRYNTQGRNINPTGDRTIAKSIDSYHRPKK